MVTIALVGDYSPDVLAHRAIPEALRLAGKELGLEVHGRWIHTTDAEPAERSLRDAAGIWLTPASPYASMLGALAAACFAREQRRPFLGTCGGFQHALIDFARNVAGCPDADHAETNTGAAMPIVARLSCSLVERTGSVHFIPGSLIAGAYGAAAAVEGYHCNYGPNPAYRALLEGAGLRFTAFDAEGAVRGAELPTSHHPFFVGTLFQPERAALLGATPPLVRAFIAAAMRS